MKRICLMVSGIVFIIFVLLDLFPGIEPGHVVFPWSHIAGFFALFGFIGCVIIIIGSKFIGHYWLQRKEDYYDKNDNDE